jgi:hypothetical protein
MRRAALLTLTALTMLFAAAAANADCADEVRAARKEAAAVKDEAHRRELSLLFDKAEKDAKAGREQLCLDAMVRAQALTR